MGDNKKGFLKYISSKRWTRDNTDPLLDEDDQLSHRDTDEAEMFNAFFISVFNANDGSCVCQSAPLGDYNLQ